MRYRVRVSSRNVFGWGPPSPPVALSTPQGIGEPQPPQPPTHLPPPDGQCDAVLLQLPPPRRGCERESTITLQMRSPRSGLWSALQTVQLGSTSSGSDEGDSAATARGRTVLITSLDPYSAYQFRLLASRGGALTSAPSTPTDLLLPGPSGESAILTLALCLALALTR